MKKDKGGRPLAFDSVEELEEKVNEFFTSDDAHIINFKEGQEEKVYAPTMSGLALFLDRLIEFIVYCHYLSVQIVVTFV